jgi:hypothetical protein
MDVFSWRKGLHYNILIPIAQDWERVPGAKSNAGIKRVWRAYIPIIS